GDGTLQRFSLLPDSLQQLVSIRRCCHTTSVCLAARWLAVLAGLRSGRRRSLVRTARYADPQVVGMVADALQQAQGFGEDYVCFRQAQPGLDTPDVHLARLPVQQVKLTLRLTNLIRQLRIAIAEGNQRLAIGLVSVSRQVYAVSRCFVGERNLRRRSCACVAGNILSHVAYPLNV